MSLTQVSNELTKRVISLFELDGANCRQLNAEQNWFYCLPENKDLVLFYEYFHGDSGRGLGASHQSGWTALVAELINEVSPKHKKRAPFVPEEEDED
jgi:hypothetical protein